MAWSCTYIHTYIHISGVSVGRAEVGERLPKMSDWNAFMMHIEVSFVVFYQCGKCKKHFHEYQYGPHYDVYRGEFRGFLSVCEVCGCQIGTHS